MRVGTRLLVALAILASLFSYFKFSHCESVTWATPDQYIHACYSDLPALVSERAFGKGEWAYSGGEQAVEYPVLQGVVMWATAQITHSPIGYFRLNALLLGALFIFTTLLFHRIKPEYSYLYAITPTAIAALYINWDIWAIATMLLSIYLFDKGRYRDSALALGVSIATKFFPIVLLLPIFIYFIRKSALRQFFIYASVSIGTFAIINLPFAITTPDGWWRFFKLNLDRQADWGSLWYALSVFGVNLTHINYLSILVLLSGVAAVAIFLLQTRETLSLSHSALYIFILVMAVSKVYSPQYVLWLAPLVLLAIVDQRDLSWFWFWQIAEMMYHIAIWQHLATVTGAASGLDATAYAAATLIRIAASLALAIALARRHPREANFRSEWLPDLAI